MTILQTCILEEIPPYAKNNLYEYVCHLIVRQQSYFVYKTVQTILSLTMYAISSVTGWCNFLKVIFQHLVLMNESIKPRTEIHYLLCSRVVYVAAFMCPNVDTVVLGG